jgi:sulfonate transport system ATP-binding protein
MVSDPMLLIDGIEISYAKKGERELVLSDFSLSVGKEESVTIIGPSGAGKTSLLYAIAGLIPLSAGTIQLDPDFSALGLMFQEDRLLPWKTVLGNVLLGLDRTTSAPQALEWLRKTGIEGHAGKYPGQLSGGERQRAALSRVLCRGADLLLMDEPFAALDEQTRETLQDELRDLVKELQLGMILVTHNIEEAVYLGERLLVLKPGSDKGKQCIELDNPSFGRENARERGDYFETVTRARAALRQSPAAAAAAAAAGGPE